MKLQPTMLKLLLSSMAFLCAAPWATANALDRMIDAGLRDPKWNTARDNTERIRLIREAALRQDVVSKPVSDRYLITEFGGPIDIVHFLGLASIVCSGKSLRHDALLEQWKFEGGPDYAAGRSRVYLTEAHPDDLPSNALGALFGEEIRAHASDLSFDLPQALRAFLAKLKPVPDAMAKRFSHTQIVMGLPENATFEQMRERSEWFTAVPLYLLPKVAPAKVRAYPNAHAALRAAGFVVRKHQGKPIVIERIPPSNR